MCVALKVSRRLLIPATCRQSQGRKRLSLIYHKFCFITSKFFDHSLTIYHDRTQYFIVRWSIFVYSFKSSSFIYSARETGDRDESSSHIHKTMHSPMYLTTSIFMFSLPTAAEALTCVSDFISIDSPIPLSLPRSVCVCFGSRRYLLFFRVSEPLTFCRWPCCFRFKRHQSNGFQTKHQFIKSKPTTTITRPQANEIAAEIQCQSNHLL